jgi:hypothetical protein
MGHELFVARQAQCVLDFPYTMEKEEWKVIQKDIFPPKAIL